MHASVHTRTLYIHTYTCTYIFLYKAGNLREKVIRNREKKSSETKN